LYIDLVVLRMRAYESNVDYAIWVVNFHNKPIGVPFDIKNNTVVAYDACIGVLCLDFRGSIPVLFLDFPIPSQKRLFCIRMFLPEFPKSSFGDYPHQQYTVFPIYIASTMLP